MDTWYGVTLNAQGCVEALGLPNNSMGHYIPIAIDQLSALKRLDLSGNNFTGCVGGSRDFWCNQLEMVDISGNVYLLYDNIEELCNPTWDFVCSPTSFDGFVGPDDLNAILNDPERFATTVSPPYHFYNCDGTNTITDDVAPGGCGPTVITRTYTLRDDNGQFRDACSQTITVSRPGFSHVVPPGPFTIGCGQAYPADGDGNPSPGFTGYPIVQTYFAEYNLAPSYDNLEASYTDDPPVLQGPGTLVIRRWTVTNSCAPGNPMAFTQNITICGNGSVLPPDMIFVEGGTYTMGCTPEQVGCEGDEAPHLVTLSDFYVGKFEVTQAEWEELMPDYVPTYGAGFGYDYPTYHISWYDAVVFCNRLSQQEGLTPCYYSDPAYTQVFDMLIGSTSVYVDVYWNAAAGGYRLPTEAEWEYAARGGALSQGYRYAGSNVLDAVAWYVGNNSPGGSKPVGQKAPNELGLYDMSGNVWEWCWDLYSTSYYADSPTCNPLGPDSSTGMVRRGGFWMGGANNCRLAFRIGSEPGNRNYTYGFRVVRGAPSSENCLNDECSTMAGLGVAPVCSQETYTNFSATASHIGPGNHPDCFYGSSTERDVWFAFSTSDTLIDVSVFLEGVEAGPNEAITNPQMALYRGDCDGGLAYLGFCTSSLDGDNQAQLDLAGLTPNTTYFIRINDYSLTADPNWGDFTLCITPYSPVSNCRMQDSLALVELYDATHENGDWVNEWDLSQPMDTWHGVVLNVDGCVDRLNLLFNNLAGELPDLNLPNLTGFSCRGNLLTGSIPDFSNLPNLLSLDCNGNEFTGGIPDFSNLPNLLYFSCSYNQLTGSIPDFANLPNLEDFFCNTAGQLDGGIPDFTNLPNLRRLWCPGNGLSGGIPDFTNLPSLETFSCSINQLSGFIPDFSNLPNLGLFNCFNNQLSGSIPDFSNTPNLSSLGCHFNQLSGQVPDFSDNCPNLQSFNFQNNLFTFEGILDGLMSPGSITYAPQDSIFTDTLIQRNVGESLTVGLGIDDTVTSNVYYWYKDGVLWNTIYGSNELSFSSLQADDAGVYHVQVQNPNAPELILLGRSITIQVGCLSNSTMLSPALCSGESL
ncbi:MAG: SUMF1/EgtB/PvdO family nonheme iron enzyme, partial [Phaeodactylibacter sp.]|nr:SUMF1/EgtB/PvdO family nonheme iron enzyme [Phaeodactylibacter sp.]